MDAIAILLDAKANPNTVVSGNTPLAEACWKGHEAVVEHLLWAKVDLKSKEGASAIHWAARRGHTPVVQLLLDCRADPDQRDARGITAREYAKKGGQSSVLRAIENYAKSPREPRTLRPRGNLASTKTGSITFHKPNQPLPVVKGSPTAATSAQKQQFDLGNSSSSPSKLRAMADALIKAASKNREGKVRALLASRADAASISRDGKQSAIHWASRYGNARLVADLIDAGADPSVRIDGNSALHEAAWKGNQKVVEHILFSRVDPNGPAGAGALHLAARRGSTGVVRLLLECRANPAYLHSGSTARGAAEAAGKATVVRTIDDFAADPKYREPQSAVAQTSVDAQGMKPRPRTRQPSSDDIVSGMGRSLRHSGGPMSSSSRSATAKKEAAPGREQQQQSEQKRPLRCRSCVANRAFGQSLRRKPKENPSSGKAEALDSDADQDNKRQRQFQCKASCHIM